MESRRTPLGHERADVAEAGKLLAENLHGLSPFGGQISGMNGGVNPREILGVGLTMFRTVHPE